MVAWECSAVGYTIHHMIDIRNVKYTIIGNQKVMWRDNILGNVEDLRDVWYHGGYHKPQIFCTRTADIPYGL